VLRVLSMLWMLVQMCTSNPQNLKACLTDQHVWLWPEVKRGWELYTRREVPYQAESDAVGHLVE